VEKTTQRTISGSRSLEPISQTDEEVSVSDLALLSGYIIEVDEAAGMAKLIIPVEDNSHFSISGRV
jgi:hypothetical protein